MASRKLVQAGHALYINTFHLDLGGIPFIIDRQPIAPSISVNACHGHLDINPRQNICQLGFKPLSMIANIDCSDRRPFWLSNTTLIRVLPVIFTRPLWRNLYLEQASEKRSGPS